MEISRIFWHFHINNWEWFTDSGQITTVTPWRKVNAADCLSQHRWSPRHAWQDFSILVFLFLSELLDVATTQREHTPPPPPTQDKWKKFGHKHMVDWLISKWIHLLVFVMLFNSVGELTTQFCSWSHSDLLNSFTESQDTIYYSWPLWEYANMCV